MFLLKLCRRALLPCCLLAPLAAAQVVFQTGPPGQPPPPTGKRYPVTGTVFNSATNEPVRRALVRLGGPEQRVAFTGADGRFEFDNVPEGAVYLSAQRPGFFDARSVRAGNLGFASSNQSMVGPGSNDFRLPLVPEARISGKVVDTDGEPLEGVQVQVLTEQIEQGRKRWTNRGRTSTDDSGVFRLDEQVPGPVILSASGTPRWGSDEVYSTRYFPDSPDQASAQILDLAAGQEARADFTLTEVRVFTVTGSISGAPANQPGIGFWAEGLDGNPIEVGQLQYRPGSGRFAIRAVPAGSWTFHFQSGDNNGHSYEAVEQVEVSDSNVQGLRVSLQSGGEIPVRINRPEAAAMASGAAQPAGNPFVQVRLASLTGPGGRQYFSGQNADPNASAETPPEIKISGVPPGRYTVTAQVSGGCLETIYYGNMDVTREPMVITGGSPPQALTVNLRNDCSSIEVKVHAASATLSGVLLLIPESSPSDAQIIGVPGNTTYNASNLSPGTYRIYALSNIDGLEYAVPDAMRGLPSEEVTLEPNQNASVSLEMAERGHS